jgi:hypothetical protein
MAFSGTVLVVAAGAAASAPGVTAVSVGGVAAAAGVMAFSGTVLVVAAGGAAAAPGVTAVSAGGVAAGVGVMAFSASVLVVAAGAAAAAAQCSEIMFSSVTAKLSSAAAELAPVALCPMRVTSWLRCGLRSTLLVVSLKMRPVLSSTTV